MKAARARTPVTAAWPRQLARLLVLVLLCGGALQLSFALRIGLMAVLDPQSTAFQRSEAWRLLTERGRLPWRQEWVDDARLSVHLKRAVIASEDAGFTGHGGVDWESIEKAWERNQRAEARAQRQQAARPAGASEKGTRRERLASPAAPLDHFCSSVQIAVMYSRAFSLQTGMNTPAALNSSGITTSVAVAMAGGLVVDRLARRGERASGRLEPSGVGSGSVTDVR